MGIQIRKQMCSKLKLLPVASYITYFSMRPSRCRGNASFYSHAISCTILHNEASLFVSFSVPTQSMEYFLQHSVSMMCFLGVFITVIPVLLTREIILLSISYIFRNIFHIRSIHIFRLTIPIIWIHLFDHCLLLDLKYMF